MKMMNKFCALMLSVALCAGMAAPAFAYGGEPTEEVEQPVLTSTTDEEDADLYDSASFEAKKMIVSQLIRRIDVYRGYQIHVDFNFDLAQYLENSDELAC